MKRQALYTRGVVGDKNNPCEIYKLELVGTQSVIVKSNIGTECIQSRILDLILA